jgi:hypothetical protein
MKAESRRHSVNPSRFRPNILKITPSIGSNKGRNKDSSENSFDEGTGFTQSGKRKLKGVKSEKRRSIKLNMDSAPLSIKAKRNYMSLQSDELEDRDILGTRKTVAMKLQSTSINIGIATLI